MEKKRDLFAEKKAAIEEKYAGNLDAFFKSTGMDRSVCFEMLLFNARCFSNGATCDIVKGGGAVNVRELLKDVAELDSCRKA